MRKIICTVLLNTRVTEHFLRFVCFSLCRMDCYYAANLLFISVGNIRITVWFESLDLENAGMALGFDTGTDLAFLRKDVYDQVLNAVSSSSILNYVAFIRN